MMHSLAWKFDKSQLEAISDVDITAKKISVSYLLVGAAARDLIDNALGISSTRLTEDIDLAIRVDGWDKFNELCAMMLSSEKFQQDKARLHRYFHLATNIPVDMIPFGPIDGVGHVIHWPAPDHTSMSTLGFEEAYNNSITVKISDEPEIIIRVSSRPGLAIMKLIAWNDNRPGRARDALDLLHLIRNYLDPDNLNRLYDEHSDITVSEDFDFECAGARLLGRDIALMASPQTLKAIDDILSVQTSDDSDSKLIFDIIGVGIGTEFGFDQLLRLLICLRDGIQNSNK